MIRSNSVQEICKELPDNVKRFAVYEFENIKKLPICRIKKGIIKKETK